MSKNNICPICKNVLNKDNIKVVEYLGQEIVVCVDCFFIGEKI